ncbi:MAG: DUF4364 family protein [Ruminococcus sp.]|nr:DUF4364 family protein [Ruminococcus sp.]
MYAYPDINPKALNPREVYEVKLLLAYFLNQIDVPCTPDQLLQIATADELVDYFLYMQSVKEMLEADIIEKVEYNGEECYALTEKGKAGADSFKRLVPKSVRDRIYASGLKLFARIKNENTVKIDICEQEKGCEVSCRVFDSGIKLMELKLFAPDTEQAEHIKDKIMQNPSAIYGRILDYVLCNSEQNYLDKD